MSTLTLGTHSAELRMWLECGDYGRVDLCRMTPQYVEAKQARTIPPCRATLVVMLDGEERRHTVDLVGGMNADDPMILALPVDDIAPF